MKPKLNLRQKLWKVLGSPVISESLNKDSLLVNVLRFFRILEDRCGNKGERLGYERSRFEIFVRFKRYTLCNWLKMAATVYKRDNCDGE